MQVARRSVLTALAGTALALGFCRNAVASAIAETAYLSAAKDSDGRFIVCGLDRAGRVQFRIPLPGRGHGTAVRPGGREAVLFARRPGNFAMVLNVRDGSVVRVFHAPENRHFYGHGAFSPDGRLLYATENDFEAARGALGIYDAAHGYTRIGEMPTHGVGPHEVLLLPDGETLAVANGGIETHPDYPRQKLNLSTMAPSLVLLCRRTGDVLAHHRPPEEWRQLSIRHIAANAAGTIAIAMQYEGPATDPVPLAAIVHPGGPMKFLRARQEEWRSMHHYTGSVAFSRSGRMIAVSAPRGNLVTVWDAETECLFGTLPADDCSGVTASAENHEMFFATNDKGQNFILNKSRELQLIMRNKRNHNFHFDNHIQVLRSL